MLATYVQLSRASDAEGGIAGLSHSYVYNALLIINA